MYLNVTLRTKFLRKDIVLQAHPFPLRITPSVMYVTQEWPVEWPVASEVISGQWNDQWPVASEMTSGQWSVK